MTRKYFNWDSFSVAAIIVCIDSVHVARADSSFEYFGTQIDYWHEKKAPLPAAPAPQTGTPPTPSNTPESGSENGFPWQTYLNPKNKEFFKEGDYTPPEPFMEIVQNPTDENLKNWFAYLNKKNELTERLQKRMQEYLNKPGQILEPSAKAYVETKIAELPKTVPNAKQFRFRLYFDSHCPHCQNMLKTLSELQSKGYFVEAKQIDRDPEGGRGFPFPVERASPQEVKEKGIQSVPLLLVGDLEKKAVYRITGYQTVASIFSALPQPGGETTK